MAAFQAVYHTEGSRFWLWFQLTWIAIATFGLVVAICRDHGWLDKK